MGGLIRERTPNGQDISVETDSIAPNGAGVLKQSTVKVAALKQAFVMGVRIGANQTIDELKFETFDVLTRADDATTKALQSALPIPAGVKEQWLGFALYADDLPHPGRFKTRFALSPFPAVGQFQVVPFVVAQSAAAFAQGAYMVTVSVVTSPSDIGPAELRRG
jgi:hypothetical protein